MEKLFCFLLVFILLNLSRIDYKTYQIPIKYNVMLALVGIIRLIYTKENPLNYILAAFIFMVFLGSMYILSRGRMIGGGDVKLMMAAGLLLGLQKGICAFFLASMMALVVEGIQKIKNREKKYFAMGPYLSAGILLMFLLN